MIENCFFKNLFQTICTFISAIMISFAFLLGFIDKSDSYKHMYWWLDLGIPILINLLFFILGSYIIFQKVIISKNGIKVVFLRKTIVNYSWDQIISIEKKHRFRNPVLEIKVISGKMLYLDRRKKIIRAIIEFSNDYKNLLDLKS